MNLQYKKKRRKGGSLVLADKQLLLEDYMKMNDKGRFMLETSRLILRQWKAKDRAPFAALNTDSDVMRFFRLHCYGRKATILPQDSRKALQSAAGDFGPLNYKKHTSLWAA